MHSPSTLSLLRAVRANLKLAINESLTNNQTELISSYLQLIIMSEGEKWVKLSTQNVVSAMKANSRRQGTAGSGAEGEEDRPVKVARKTVVAFATRELRSLEKGSEVASVEECVHQPRLKS